MSIPSHASVVIIGGGVAGCSIAYHLTKLGVSDVVLLERRQLTCGTTWHAAGLVGQLRATRNLTELAKYTAELYRSLEAETGQATGFSRTARSAVAKTAARFEELKRGASHGPMLRPRNGRAHARRDQGTLAAADGRRSGRRHIHPQGRPDQSDRHDPGAREGREAARRTHLREHARSSAIHVERGRAAGG